MRKETQAAVRSRSARRLRDALLLALAAAIAGFWIYFHAVSPGTALRAWNPDPEAAYFVSSLAVFAGQPYVLVQHPGTPVSVIGTVLIALTWPFLRGSPADFVARLVERPEIFFTMAHALLATANLACVMALGRRALSVRRPADALMAAAIPASFFAVVPHAFFWTFYWSHNAAAFSAGSVLLLVLLASFRRGRLPATPVLWAIGLGAGVLAATQLYFAAWILGAMGAVALVANARRGARGAIGAAGTVAGASLAAFALCAIPMIPGRRVFVHFMRAVLSRQGAYGSGAGGFWDWATWLENLRRLLADAPTVFAACGLSFALIAVGLAGRGRARAGGLRAVAIGIAVQWLAMVILLGRHPSRFYLPALAAMLPLLLAIAFALWRRRGDAARYACAAVAVAALGGAARTLASDVRALGERLAFRSAMEAEVARRVAVASAARGPVLLLWGPGLADTPCYALWMGIQYSNGALHREVSRACPSEGLAWSTAVVMPDGWPAAGEIPALLVTTDAILARIPALDFGAAEIAEVRDPSGARLAFQSVTVVGGRARPASR
jgi:hypothetical protein